MSLCFRWHPWQIVVVSVVVAVVDCIACHSVSESLPLDGVVYVVAGPPQVRLLPRQRLCLVVNVDPHVWVLLARGGGDVVDVGSEADSSTATIARLARSLPPSLLLCLPALDIKQYISIISFMSFFKCVSGTYPCDWLFGWVLFVCLCFWAFLFECLCNLGLSENVKMKILKLVAFFLL